MKNKTVNKKVLRAMSIGLAAMMTVQPVMATPVFADDLDTQGETNTEVVDAQNEEKVTESTTTQDNLKEIQESYDDAAEAVSNIGNDLNTAVQADRVDPDFTSTDGASTKLTELNNAVTGTKIGAVDAKTLDGDRKAASDAAINLVNDAKRDGAEFELDADELMKGGVEKALKGEAIEQAAEAVDDAINEESKALDKLEEDTIKLTNEFTGIEGTIRVKTGEIERATSIPVATEALDGATEQKNIADEKFEQAKANYNQAVSDCNAAKKDVEAKKAAYEKLLASAVADESALSNTLAELELAEKDLTALKNANKKAQEDLKKTTIGKLAAAVGAGSDWKNLDVIMQDVIKYYYLPGQTVDGKEVSPSDITVTRVGDPANERNNYFKATVFGKDFYYNYICEENGKNSAYLSKMVIFEKNPELIGHHYEVDGTEKKCSSDEVTENQVTLEFIKDKTSTDSTGKFIINNGTTYHINSEGVTEVTAGDMSGVTINEAGKSGSYISNVEEGETSTEFNDGVLTVKTEGSITTTTFVSGNTLDDIESSKSESSYKDAVYAAKAARDEAVNNALAEGHTLQNDGNGDIISSVTTVSAKASATATVEYKTKFTTTIDLTKVTAKYDKSDWDLGIGSKKEKKAVVDAVKKLVNEIIEAYLNDNKLYDPEQDFEVSYTNLSTKNINRDVKIGDNIFEFTNGASVSFTYYSKANPTATGYASDTNTNVTDDMSTEKLLKDAKAKASSKASSASHAAAADNNSKIANVVKNARVEAKKNKYATFKLGKDAITTTVDVVKIKEEADSSVKYNYKVSNITYADQYDTVEDEQTIYSKNLYLSALTDDYADIPLLNNNYYNYMADKTNKTGIVADFGDTADGIRASVMNDSNKVKDLAAKYKEAETKAANAKNNVTTAKGEVQALIKQIKDLQLEANEYDKKVQAELKALEAKLIAAKSKLDEAEAEKAKVDATYERALAAYKDAVARLTPAPATGDEETAPTAGGGTTTAPAPAVVTTLAGTPVFALPAGGVAAPAAGVAGARTSRGAAIDSDSAAADTEDTTAKIAPTKEVEEDALAITKDTIKTIKDNETPLSSLTEDSTQKMNWWWLLLIALLGATGEEIYRRNKKKKEEEAALKAEIDKE